jgi:ATP-dependent helicase HrpB
MTALPIDIILPELTHSLRLRPNAVLIAPPGAGKTTRVPVKLLTEPWLEGRRILMLEPRRLAARAAARYMAASLGERVGGTVGYRVRMDTKAGPSTRIEVITEGVLTRMLQADAALEGVGAIIFDEFHERSVHADLGLAFCLQAQSVLRPDLRILVMSATLDAGAVAALLGDAPVLFSEGQVFPIETRYTDHRIEGSVEPAVVRTIQHSLVHDEGDILVFLPGAGEIRRVEAALRAAGVGQEVTIAPLFGNLRLEDQDAAIAPSPAGHRKIVLATSIAETSLTVEGVRVIIDCGQMRVSRFSPRLGMTRLETIPVSRAAADQRRGRAGRLGPGICYRLWTEQDDHRLEPRSKPEILEADLTPLALELAVWGIVNPEDLLWLDVPPVHAYEHARGLLRRLGAITAEGIITLHGRRMAETGLHPRLAHMILKAAPISLGSLACKLAVLLNERDIFRNGIRDVDMRHRVEMLNQIAGNKSAGEVDSQLVDIALCRRILSEIRYLKKECAVAEGTEWMEACGILLAFAYPDRIAQRRSDGRYLMRNGRGAALTAKHAIGAANYLVAAELDDQGADSRIYLAAPVETGDLWRHFEDEIEEELSVVWDRSAQAVRSYKRQKLGALILKEVPAEPSAEDLLTELLQGIAGEGLTILPWSRGARQLRQRIQFIHRIEPDWPDLSEEALVLNLKEWLSPYLYGLSSRSDLQRLNLAEILQAMLTWDQRRELDEAVPAHITVPSGQRIPVDYSDPAAPVLAVRLQELFGLMETPRIARGKVPLTLHLLSPAHRPVQMTKDLASFWQDAYFEVRKELLGRYPKHYWPEDPLSAAATHRTRPRS